MTAEGPPAPRTTAPPRGPAGDAEAAAHPAAEPVAELALPRSEAFAGQGASAGIAYGPMCASLESLEDGEAEPLAEDAIEAELARLDSVARAARVSLVRQREALSGKFTEAQLRVFDAHLQMLEDPVIEADVRERIAKQGMRLEAAVKDSLSVYERLFDVVQSENLRNKMSDMRDVALRLLRFCGRGGGRRRQLPNVKGAVLVVRELSVSDLTDALESGVAAIVAEAGNLGSHGSILTRAAGIPAVIGVGAIAAGLRRGDMLMVDGESGTVTVNPSSEMVGGALGRTAEGIVQPLAPAELADGAPVELLAAVASPREARIAVGLGVPDVGLYRTELPLIQRQGAPREAALVALYRQVINAVETACIRLPDLDSTTDLATVYPRSEINPALGLRGVRLLHQREEMLAVQLRAVMLAGEGRLVRLAVPFVNDPSDLARVRDAMHSAREELRLDGADVSKPVELGPVFETPAAALLVRELLAESDFALVSFDTLAQYLVAADRHHTDPQVRKLAAGPHPVVLRALRKIVMVADGMGVDLTVYGESLEAGPTLPLLLGLGVRRFALRPGALRAVHGRLGRLVSNACEEVAEDACRVATTAQVTALVPPEWAGAD
ncbi:MAG TPA: putative PEP-binding protein [Planctomycetota bacterium]